MAQTPKDIDFINLNDINTAPEVIPAAEYHLKVMEMDLRENKQKDGMYLNYRVTVQSGEYAGHSFYSMWSFKENALWKLKRDFKAMSYAPADGIPHIADLLGFEGIALVEIRPADGNYDAKNDIKKWLAPLK